MALFPRDVASEMTLGLFMLKRSDTVIDMANWTLSFLTVPLKSLSTAVGMLLSGQKIGEKNKRGI